MESKISPTSNSSLPLILMGGGDGFVQSGIIEGFDSSSWEMWNTGWIAVGGGRQKTLCVTLTYVEITSSGINCALKNSREGKSRSGKVIKKGI